MRTKQLMYLALGAVLMLSCRREGCTDQTALNYDPKAKKENFTCIYQDGSSNDPGGNPSGQGPILLSGTENDNKTIANIYSNSNLYDYYIDGTWRINAAVTIEPGVRILMKANSRIVVETAGSLDATGNAVERIEFIGEQDIQGYWYNIEFNSNNPNNKLIQCVVANGGYYYNSSPGMIVLSNNARVIIQSTAFRKGSGNGIYTAGSDSKLPYFESNSFSEFSKAPLSLHNIVHADFINASNSFASSNAVPRIELRAGTSTGDALLRKLDIPFYLLGNNTIQQGHVAVEPGTTLIMADNSRILVESSASFAINGNFGDACTVKGEHNVKGYWYNITYNSNNPNNVITYTNISDGREYYSSSPGMVRINNNASLSMGNSVLSNTGTSAVDGPGNFSDNGGNSWSDCDGGGGLLP